MNLAQQAIKAREKRLGREWERGRQKKPNPVAEFVRGAGGFAADFGKEVASDPARAASSVGRGIPVGAGKSVELIAEGATPLPQGSDLDLTPDKFIPPDSGMPATSMAGQGIGSILPYVGAGAAAGAVGGPKGAALGALIGGALGMFQGRGQSLEMGRESGNPATAMQQARGAGIGLTEMAPFMPLGRMMNLGRMGNIAATSAGEGMQEGASEIMHGANMGMMPTAEQVGESAMIGAFAGAPAGAVMPRGRNGAEATPPPAPPPPPEPPPQPDPYPSVPPQYRTERAGQRPPIDGIPPEQVTAGRHRGTMSAGQVPAVVPDPPLNAGRTDAARADWGNTNRIVLKPDGTYDIERTPNPAPASAIGMPPEPPPARAAEEEGDSGYPTLPSRNRIEAVNPNDPYAAITTAGPARQRGRMIASGNLPAVVPEPPSASRASANVDASDARANYFDTRLRSALPEPTDSPMAAKGILADAPQGESRGRSPIPDPPPFGAVGKPPPSAKTITIPRNKPVDNSKEPLSVNESEGAEKSPRAGFALDAGAFKDSGLPAYRGKMNAKDLSLNPDKWQSRAADSERLGGVGRWRTEGNQRFVAVETSGGSVEVVDGHNRKRTMDRLVEKGEMKAYPEVEVILLREADGWTQDKVLQAGAEMNILNNTATPFDVARATMGMENRQEFKGKGWPDAEGNVATGWKIGRLSNENVEWLRNEGDVTGSGNGIPARYAAAVGEVMPGKDEESGKRQRHALEMIRDRGIKSESEAQAVASLVAAPDALGDVSEADMFGTGHSDAIERAAKILKEAKGAMLGKRTLGRTGRTKGEAIGAEELGSVDREKSGALESRAKNALASLTQATRRGTPANEEFRKLAGDESLSPKEAGERLAAFLLDNPAVGEQKKKTEPVGESKPSPEPEPKEGEEAHFAGMGDISTKELLERQAAKPNAAKKPQQPLPAGGIFDMDARNQVDLEDAVKAKKADAEPKRDEKAIAEAVKGYGATLRGIMQMIPLQAKDNLNKKIAELESDRNRVIEAGGKDSDLTRLFDSESKKESRESLEKVRKAIDGDRKQFEAVAAIVDRIATGAAPHFSVIPADEVLRISGQYKKGEGIGIAGKPKKPIETHSPKLATLLHEITHWLFYNALPHAERVALLKAVNEETHKGGRGVFGRKFWKDEPEGFTRLTYNLDEVVAIMGEAWMLKQLPPEMTKEKNWEKIARRENLAADSKFDKAWRSFFNSYVKPFFDWIRGFPVPQKVAEIFERAIPPGGQITAPIIGRNPDGDKPDSDLDDVMFEELPLPAPPPRPGAGENLSAPREKAIQKWLKASKIPSVWLHSFGDTRISPDGRNLIVSRGGETTSKGNPVTMAGAQAAYEAIRKGAEMIHARMKAPAMDRLAFGEWAVDYALGKTSDKGGLSGMKPMDRVALKSLRKSLSGDSAMQSLMDMPAYLWDALGWMQRAYRNGVFDANAAAVSRMKGLVYEGLIPSQTLEAYAGGYMASTMGAQMAKAIIHTGRPTVNENGTFNPAGDSSRSFHAALLRPDGRKLSPRETELLHDALRTWDYASSKAKSGVERENALARKKAYEALHANFDSPGDSLAESMKGRHGFQSKEQFDSIYAARGKVRVAIDDMMEFAVDAGVWTRADADRMRDENPDYVPAFKPGHEVWTPKLERGADGGATVMFDEAVARYLQGIARTAQIHRSLKALASAGTKTGGVVEITAAAMGANAALGSGNVETGSPQIAGTSSGEGAMFLTIENGKRRYYSVSDQHFAEGILMLRDLGVSPEGIDLLANRLRTFDQIMTALNPSFQLVVGFKEVLFNLFSSDANPRLPSAANVKALFKNAVGKDFEGVPEIYVTGYVNGANMGGGRTVPVNPLADVVTGRQIGSGEASSLKNLGFRYGKKGWNLLGAGLSLIESANRGALLAAAYNKAIADGYSHEDAIAKGVNNANRNLFYGAKGKWAPVRGAASVIPFANAFLKGFGRTGTVIGDMARDAQAIGSGKGTKEIKSRFARRMIVLAGALAVMAHFNAEEEEMLEGEPTLSVSRRARSLFRIYFGDATPGPLSISVGGRKSLDVPAPFEVGSLLNAMHYGGKYLSSGEGEDLKVAVRSLMENAPLVSVPFQEAMHIPFPPPYIQGDADREKRWRMQKAAEALVPGLGVPIIRQVWHEMGRAPFVSTTKIWLPRADLSQIADKETNKHLGRDSLASNYGRQIPLYALHDNAAKGFRNELASRGETRRAREELAALKDSDPERWKAVMAGLSNSKLVGYLNKKSTAIRGLERQLEDPSLPLERVDSLASSLARATFDSLAQYEAIRDGERKRARFEESNLSKALAEIRSRNESPEARREAFRIFAGQLIRWTREADYGIYNRWFENRSKEGFE